LEGGRNSDGSVNINTFSSFNTILKSAEMTRESTRQNELKNQNISISEGGAIKGINDAGTDIQTMTKMSTLSGTQAFNPNLNIDRINSISQSSGKFDAAIIMADANFIKDVGIDNALSAQNNKKDVLFGTNLAIREKLTTARKSAILNGHKMRHGTSIIGMAADLSKIGQYGIVSNKIRSDEFSKLMASSGYNSQVQAQVDKDSFVAQIVANQNYLDELLIGAERVDANGKKYLDKNSIEYKSLFDAMNSLGVYKLDATNITAVMTAAQANLSASGKIQSLSVDSQTAEDLKSVNVSSTSLAKFDTNTNVSNIVEQESLIAVLKSPEAVGAAAAIDELYRMGSSFINVLLNAISTLDVGRNKRVTDLQRNTAKAKLENIELNKTIKANKERITAILKDRSIAMEEVASAQKLFWVDAKKDWSALDLKKEDLNKEQIRIDAIKSENSILAKEKQDLYKQAKSLPSGDPLKKVLHEQIKVIGEKQLSLGLKDEISSLAKSLEILSKREEALIEKRTVFNLSQMKKIKIATKNNTELSILKKENATLKTTVQANLDLIKESETSLKSFFNKSKSKIDRVKENFRIESPEEKQLKVAKADSKLSRATIKAEQDMKAVEYAKLDASDPRLDRSQRLAAIEKLDAAEKTAKISNDNLLALHNESTLLFKSIQKLKGSAKAAAVAGGIAAGLITTDMLEKLIHDESKSELENHLRAGLTVTTTVVAFVPAVGIVGSTVIDSVGKAGLDVFFDKTDRTKLQLAGDLTTKVADNLQSGFFDIGGMFVGSVGFTATLLGTGGNLDKSVASYKAIDKVTEHISLKASAGINMIHDVASSGTISQESMDKLKASDQAIDEAMKITADASSSTKTYKDIVTDSKDAYRSAKNQLSSLIGK
jgi:hypothetical protein